MPQRQYDIALTSGVSGTVVETNGSSIGSSAMRLIVDDVNCPTKADAIKLIEILEYYLVNETWPPA